VLGGGPQIGFLFPVGDTQGDAANRPSGWNTQVTFSIPRPERLRQQKPIGRKY